MRLIDLEIQVLGPLEICVKVDFRHLKVSELCNLSVLHLLTERPFLSAQGYNYGLVSRSAAFTLEPVKMAHCIPFEVGVNLLAYLPGAVLELV